MALRLLHLSDIHFTSFNGKDYLDQDSDIRNELENDLEEIIRTTGSIDAILIGGDISFSGKESEFQIADIWIKKVCTIVGCSEENVLTVPGNHDIDRSKICSVVNAIHSNFKILKSRTAIDDMLKGFLESDESCSILLRPLNNYLNFAQKFGVVPGHNPLYWEKDFPVDGEILRIRGINSAIISDNNDDENKSKLVLGSIQTQFNRESGVIYLVLCHHPPEWLIDQQEVDIDLLARTKLQLFGHKHILDVLKMDECLRLTSGAMHPSRADKGWEPRYNIIELNIIQKSGENILNAKIWERVWDKKKLRFIPDYSNKGEEIHSIDLKHEHFKSKHISDKKERIENENKIGGKMSPEVEVINVKKPDPIRKLAYLFLSLPYHKKINIANELKFIEDTDKDLTDVQKSQAYFERAIKNDCLDQLWDMVVAGTNEKIEMSNPFKKI